MRCPSTFRQAQWNAAQGTKAFGKCKWCFPFETGSGTESAVESNWVVVQNFLTRTPLNENFLLVSFAIKSKLHSFTLPMEECLKTENYEL